MLSIGGDDLAKSTIFRYWGGWFSKIDTSANVQFFAQNEVKTKKKIITFADAQFWDMKILGGGGAAGLLGEIYPSMDLHPWLWRGSKL